MTERTDVIIIGAGPAGLFAVFELGLLELGAHIIDNLDRPGGQCAELYPDKPIFDIPAVPAITGEDLVVQLMKQIEPFKPVLHLGELATELRERPEGGWLVRTDRGTEIAAPVVVIAAGPGSFQPKRPKIAGIEAFEDRSVFYAVRDKEKFRDKEIVVAGGGDSALDWTLALQPLAGRLTLVHHREGFRAASHSVSQMKALAEDGKIDFLIGKIAELNGSEGRLQSVEIALKDGGTRKVACEALLPFFGLTMKLGPLAEFGLNLHENRIPVDTEKFETDRRGLFAIGDICHYPGKLKLILSGFHEAALMAHAAFHIARPDQKLKFQHTTSSTALQERLGVR